MRKEGSGIDTSQPRNNYYVACRKYAIREFLTLGVISAESASRAPLHQLQPLSPDNSPRNYRANAGHFRRAGFTEDRGSRWLDLPQKFEFGAAKKTVQHLVCKGQGITGFRFARQWNTICVGETSMILFSLVNMDLRGGGGRRWWLVYHQHKWRASLEESRQWFKVIYSRTTHCLDRGQVSLCRGKGVQSGAFKDQPSTRLNHTQNNPSSAISL